jgi:hypothetical protein
MRGKAPRAGLLSIVLLLVGCASQEKASLMDMKMEQVVRRDCAERLSEFYECDAMQFTIIRRSDNQVEVMLALPSPHGRALYGHSFVLDKKGEKILDSHAVM